MTNHQSYYHLGNIVLRREHFGCIVCCFDNNLYHQFNHDATDILFLFKPTTLISKNDLIQQISLQDYEITEEELTNFLDNLCELHVLKKGSKNTSVPLYSKQKILNHKIVKEDRLSAPTNVSIHTTQFCPKECKHCVTSSSPQVNRSNELSTKQWFAIFEKLKDFGCTNLIFTGGDCFARKDIMDIFRKVNDLGFLIAILSDYDGMQKKRLLEIKQLEHVVEFQMSLDGATAESHDWMRGKGAFDHALKRMSLLHECGLNYTISSVIHKNNLAEVEAIAELCREYHAYNFYLSPLCPYGRGINLESLLLNKEELWELGQKYLKLIRDGKTAPGNPFWNENLDKIDNKNFHPFEFSIDAVSTGYYNMSIDWKGDCFLDTKFRSRDYLTIGNALNENLADIWNNKKLDNIRKLSDPNSVYIHQNQADTHIKI